MARMSRRNKMIGAERWQEEAGHWAPLRKKQAKATQSKKAAMKVMKVMKGNEGEGNEEGDDSCDGDEGVTMLL